MSRKYDVRNKQILALNATHPEWSCRQIAEHMGISRNTVVGLFNRSGRITSNGKWRKKPRQSPPAPEGCRYITGDPTLEGWHYCQAKAVDPNRVWCRRHFLACVAVPKQPVTVA